MFLEDNVKMNLIANALRRETCQAPKLSVKPSKLKLQQTNEQKKCTMEIAFKVQSITNQCAGMYRVFPFPWLGLFSFIHYKCTQLFIYKFIQSKC